MEIITERLEREFDLDIITTTPSVRYRLTLTDGTVEMIDNPSSYPDPSNIVKQEEPFVDVHLYTPNDYVGGTSIRGTKPLYLTGRHSAQKAY